MTSAGPPGDINSLLAVGLRLHQSGRGAAAETLYRRVLEFDRYNADALHLLGLLDISFQRVDDALAHLGAAAQLRPQLAAFQSDYAIGLRTAHRLDEALALARQGVELDPALPSARYVLATVHRALGEWEACYQEVRLAAASDSRSLHVHMLHNVAAVRTHRLPAAIAAGEACVRLAPTEALTHWNLALCLLASGEFERGWAEFEWRLKAAGMEKLRRDFSQPIWHRQDVSNATLLLHCEGGFGDALQFVRYLPLVEQSVANVILECPPALHALFARLRGRHQLIARGETIPPVDFHCPLQSLPFNFRTMLATIPATIPYLHADARRAVELRRKLSLGDGLRVGLTWAGSPNPEDKRSRSLATFAVLANVEGVDFVSLQKEPEAADPPPRMRLIDAAPLLDDFAATADVIAGLDLVISVDTSVAHLAGAMGKPTWVLLPHSPDFRWMLGRADSPWYPTMRLFRQSDPRNWSNVVQQVADALRAFAASPR